MADPIFKLRWRLNTMLVWLIWGASLTVVLYLWADVGQKSPIIAFAERIEHKVGATFAARVMSIDVKVGQRVTTGQVLARLDPVDIEAQIRIQQAEVGLVKAEMKAKASRTLLRVLNTSRGLAQAEQGAGFDLARARAQYRARRAELAALAKKRHELQQLLRQKLAVRQRLLDTDVAYATLTKHVEAAGTLIRFLQRRRGASEALRQSLPNTAVDHALAPLKARLDVVQRRIERLRNQRAGLVLRAPADGLVSMVLLRAGEVARVGRPVVAMVANSQDRLVACVYENQATAMRLGAAVKLYSRGGPSKTLDGRIVALAPMVTELPDRCRAQPRQRVWGRHVVIRLTTPRALLAGEGFNVRLENAAPAAGNAAAAPSRGKRTTTIHAARHPEAKPAPLAAPLPGGTVRPMVVPASLRQLSRFEPSGLVWVPRLNRYVIVSDDTGHKHRNDHAPWLFTMDRDGKVDGQPIVVSGLRRFNDLESIAPRQGGGLYVLASQSHSKKGKRKRSRQAFIALTACPKGYSRDGRVTVAELLDQASAGQRAALGLMAGTRWLNIEGMTRTRKGGLLIGLKAPLDDASRALIWWMRYPERFLRSGRLEQAGLSLYATVKLVVKAEGQNVAGGISELLELADGSLLIAATASGIKTPRQSGSLWQVAATSAQRPASGKTMTLAAKRWKVFAGRKPEGLALSARPGRIVVAFDAGAHTPFWLELPWPTH